MIRDLLPQIEFNSNLSCIITCRLYEGDRPAYNYLQEEVIQEIEHMGLDKELSFIVVQSPSLALVGYILVKGENYHNHPNGLRIHSVGYATDEVFHFLIAQLIYLLSLQRDTEGMYKYDYIWGYEFEDYSLIEDDFRIEYSDNIFMRLLR